MNIALKALVASILLLSVFVSQATQKEPFSTNVDKHAILHCPMILEMKWFTWAHGLCQKAVQVAFMTCIPKKRVSTIIV